MTITVIVACSVAIAALLIVIFIIAVWARPSQFRIARAGTIDAPSPLVHANIDDFHRWQAWSPWAKLDPTAKNSYDGPSSGTGAGFGWDGNGKVGAGHMTIVASLPHRITIRLDFFRPFKAQYRGIHHHRGRGADPGDVGDVRACPVHAEGDACCSSIRIS